MGMVPVSRRGRFGRSLGGFALAVAAAASLATPALASGDAAAARDTGQIVSWASAADRIGAVGSDFTVRDIVHTTVAGGNARLRLSNAFGTGPVTFDAVYLGRQDSGAAVRAGSNRQVRFGGSTSVTVPPGAEVLSDPAGAVPAGANLAVSVHVAGDPGTVTGHQDAQQDNYVATGNAAADGAATAYTKTVPSWYWLDGVTVDGTARARTVVALGDSITDGYQSTVDANRRWPDDLATRLRAAGVSTTSVANEGISANKVTVDGAGQSVQARFDRDVLAQPGLSTVVYLEGINDIGGGNVTSAAQLIAADRQLVARAHADGKRIIGATLTPFRGAGYFSDAKEQIRERLNQWIRTSGVFDGVADFDKATRDPFNTSVFRAAYDSGDHLHPNDAGYRAMAAAIDLAQLR